MNSQQKLAGQLLQELLFIQTVLEGLPAVDENYRDLVGKLALKLVVGFNVNLTPSKSAPPLQF